MTDDIVIRTIDILGRNSPFLVFALGVLVILTILAIRLVPFFKEVQIAKIDIAREAEARKAEELKTSGEFLEQTKRSNAIIESLTTQTAVLNAQLEASRTHSAKMGETVAEIDETTKQIAVQVDDIHLAILRSRD